VLMHVAESAASRYLGTESSDEETRQDIDTLHRIAAKLTAGGFRARVLLGNGDVKSELARMVAEEGSDLLVTGSHGHGFFRDLVLGATASGLRHRVRCPVLTVRADGGTVRSC
jgi:manganese transport protein